MAIQLPSKLAETGFKADHARAINQLIEAVRRVQLVAGPGQRVEQNANGTTLKTPVMSSTVQTSEESWFY
mgnify:FL=1|jgi:hypothetical protein